jgi:hypothetical protein
MKVNGLWSFVGAIVLLGLVATILTKNNTSTDTTAFGSALGGLLGAATAG